MWPHVEQKIGRIPIGRDGVAIGGGVRPREREEPQLPQYMSSGKVDWLQFGQTDKNALSYFSSSEQYHLVLTAFYHLRSYF